MPIVRAAWLGRIAYAPAFELQRALADRLAAGEIDDTLLLLEHDAVYTLGRRATDGEVLLDADALAARGIAVERTDRGGRVTYHGPGQLVGYPIVRLRARGLSVPCYVHALELAIVDALGEIGVSAHVDDEHVGVWSAAGKIAAIGVAQRHGVSLHGFAVNLQPDLSHFTLINPCGIGDLGVTSAAAILGHPVDVNDFKPRIARALDEQLTLVGCATPR